MFNFSSVKGFLGYGTPHEEQTRRFDRQQSTHGQKRELDRPDMVETKRARMIEQAGPGEVRETSSTKERSSIDSRRKGSDRGYWGQPSASGSAEDSSARRHDHSEQPIVQAQKREVEKPEQLHPRRARTIDDVDLHETSSMKEPVSKDSSKKLSRHRAYSASAQDIPSMKSRSATPFEDPRKEPAPAEAAKKDIPRGRSISVARKEAKGFEIVDDRSVERPRKRRDASTARDPIMMDLIEHNNALKKMMETTQDFLKRAEQKKIELHRSNNALRDEKARLLERESEAKREAATRERDAQQRVTELLAKNRKQEDEIRMLRERLRFAEEKNSQTSNLLQVRTADLKGAETFLTAADQYSGSDIISMVEILNAEIFQAAAYMAELLEDPSMVATEDERKKSLQKYVRPLEDARHEIGDVLFAYFLEKGGDVRADPLPLQLAFQSLFTRWCAFMIHRFSGNGFNGDLAKLYQEIQALEAQPVAGRWRAITYAHVKGLDHATFSDQILDMAIGLLCLCGWSLNSPRSQKAILSMQQMVRAIEKLWIRLKTATKEGITAADIDVFVIDFDRTYDNARMEDSYSDTSNKSTSKVSITNGDKVLCTVGMGLQKTLVKRMEGMAPEKQVDVLVRSKVALEVVLRDIASNGADSVDKVPEEPGKMDGKA